MKRANYLLLLLMVAVLCGTSACTSTKSLTKVQDQDSTEFASKRSVAQSPALTQKQLVRLEHQLIPKALANTVKAIPMHSANEPAVIQNVKTVEKAVANKEVVAPIAAVVNKMTTESFKANKKEVRKAIKALKKEKRADVSEDKLILILITLFIPPLAMYLYEGDITKRFWLSLLLSFLFFFPGFIYTLIIILGDK